MIKTTPFVFLLLSLTLCAQNAIEREISGVITHDHTPLSNTTILIKSSKKGTSTNSEGVYKIRAKEGDILQFTHLNMKTIEILIEDVTTILNISMSAYENVLDEVIITSKKQRQEKLRSKKPKKISSGSFNTDIKRAGYSVGYIKGEDLNLSAIKIGRALLGRFAGIRLGQEGRISIRGTGSPIWVVDGQVFESEPNLPLESIKEVAVLRSLASVNRFGSIAVGGAIIINTKVASSGLVEEVYSKENPYTNKEYYNEGAVAYESLSVSKSNSILELESILENISESNTAFEKYRELLSKYQIKPDFYLYTADYFKRKYNDFENYKKILLDSEEYSKSNPEELKIIAYKYQQEGFYENALSVYKKIIKLRPKYAQSYRDIMNVYTELKQYKKALNTYNYYFKKGFTSEKNGIGEIMTHEAEALTSKILRTNLPDEKTYDVRIIFEWSTSEAEFTLEFVNPQKQVYKIEHTLSDSSELILDEKQKGYSSKEFVIDGDIQGEWLVNLTYYGNKKYTPTYLKTTVFNNWGRTSETKETTVYKLTLKDQKMRLFKINTY